MMNIEVVYALPERQYRQLLKLPVGSTINDALAALNFEPYSLITDVKVGIFGKEKPLDYALLEGERLEIYRPLLADPKERRRLKVDKTNLPRRCR